MKKLFQLLLIIFIAHPVHAGLEVSLDDEGFLWKKNLKVGDYSFEGAHDDLQEILNDFKQRLDLEEKKLVDIVRSVMIGEGRSEFMDVFCSLNHRGDVMSTLLEDWQKTSASPDVNDYIDESFFDDRRVGKLITDVFKRLKTKNFCLGSISYFDPKNRKYRVLVSTTSVGHPVTLPQTVFHPDDSSSDVFNLSSLGFEVDRSKAGETLYYDERGQPIWGA